MLNRHFTLPSSAKLRHHGNKDHPLLSTSLPSRRQPFIYQKPSTPSPIHLPLVPFTHRVNPYFHPHEGLLMIGTSPLRTGEEPPQKLTTKITSFPQQEGTLDSPFPNGRGGWNLKQSPLRPTEVFSIMGRNLGQRLYTRSLVIDRCSVDQQKVAEQDSTCTCNKSTCTCTCTGTCSCEDDVKNKEIERSVSKNSSTSNCVSKTSLGRKKVRGKERER